MGPNYNSDENLRFQFFCFKYIMTVILAFFAGAGIVILAFEYELSTEYMLVSLIAGQIVLEALCLFLTIVTGVDLLKR